MSTSRRRSQRQSLAAKPAAAASNGHGTAADGGEVSSSQHTVQTNMPSLPAYPKLVNVALVLLPLSAVVSFALTKRIPNYILWSTLLSVLSYLLTIQLIPSIAVYTKAAGLSGRDINKSTRDDPKVERVPEALGVVCGVICVLSLIVLQLMWKSYTLHGGDLQTYNAVLHCISFTLLLGFTDDVMNLPWRYKLVVPTIGSLPLLVTYSGGTNIIVPKILHQLFGLPSILDLGILYYVYMSMLSVFCTNAINIYAGINGLEAGQSFVIGVAVLIHNLLEITTVGVSQYHLFSIVIMLPFMGVTLGLLQHNWYPSKVFVGDTYTYFAGVVFASVGIAGHFSKTLLLFFIPQIINFLYSLPQILRIFGLTCPRHRLPKYNTQTGLLEAIPYHMNLVNLTLMVTGPLSERALCVVLMGFQVFCCAIGFLIRYHVASYFY